MKYHKLKAGETTGTYVVDSPVTEADILPMPRPTTPTWTPLEDGAANPPRTRRVDAIAMPDEGE